MDFSAGSLFAGLVLGSVGFGLFLYGKKQLRYPQLAVGLVMMIYPYFVGGLIQLFAIAAALVLGLILALRLGM